MELIHIKNDDFFVANKSVVALGSFDGIHLGHQKLLEKAIQISKNHNFASAVMIVYPHPLSILNQKLFLGYINTFFEQCAIFQQYGVDYLYVLDFNEDISKINEYDFYTKYLQKFTSIVIGKDYTFGYLGKGNYQTLINYHQNVSVIETLTINGEKCSSRKIRSLLLDGNVKEASKLLGREYKITSKVIEGRKKGREIGIPTANIRFDETLCPLKNGVYATITIYQGIKYLSMTNIGHNPTFNYIDAVSIENHIFNFNKELYGEIIEIRFIERIRDEIKFSDVEQLIKQLKKDKVQIMNKYGGTI